MWNTVPCNTRELRRAGGDKKAEVEAPVFLKELLDLLPDLQVVVLAGRTAWETFQHLSGDSSVLVVSTAEVRDGPLDGRPRERATLQSIWSKAAAAAAPMDDLELGSASGGLPELFEQPGESTTVVVQPIGERQVVAFGSDADLAALGRVGDKIPSSMVTALRTGAATMPSVAKAATSGRVVWLTKESAKLLKQGTVVSGGGGTFLGVVRDASTGRWMGQMRFKDLGRMSAAMSVPDILAAAAQQQQLTAIENKLVAVQERLDELVGDRRVELEAGLDTNLEILAEVSERTQRRDELEPAQWQRLAAIEPAESATSRSARGLRSQTSAPRSTLIERSRPGRKS